MPTPTLVPKFNLTFDILAGTLTFTDESTNRDSNTIGTPKITHVTSGTIVLLGSGWDPTTPTWDTPPIDGSGPTWEIADIALPTVYNGQYKVEYWTLEGGEAADYAPVLTTRLFTLDYTAPVVSIELTVLCSTSQLTSEDTTDYNITAEGAQVAPTMSRTHTITKPAGSGYTGTLEWVDAGTIAARTIGGGSTPGTRLWTRVWQTNIVTTLSYVLDTWGTDAMGVVLTDTAYGDDNTFAQCDATICALAQCYANLLSRWRAAITAANFNYRENKRDIVIAASGLWDQFLWYERCGTDTETTILALQAILAGENCDCTTVDDEVSEVIVPWSALTGSGTTASDFVYHFGAVDPSDGLGTNGDVYQQTADGNAFVEGDIFAKIAGSWVLKTNIIGATGADGTNTNNLQVLLNDPTERSTPAGTAKTLISYDFSLDITRFDSTNDFMVFEFEVKLAQNQRGKLLELDIAGANIMSYFTDDLVTADNERVIVRMIFTPQSDVIHNVRSEIIRSGNGGDIIGPIVDRTFTLDINTVRSVALWGTNSEAFASDIIGDRTKIKLYHRDTTLIPATTPPLASGRGVVSQRFVATAGQTTFTVTAFTANDFYIPLIDDVPQSQLVVTRSGQVFTYLPGLSLGQVLLIVD